MKVRITGNNAPIRKTEYFEVIVPQNSTQTRFYLPDVQNLRNVHLIGLEMPNVTTFPNGITNLPVLNTQKMFLTLQLYNGKEAIKDYPAFRLDPDLKKPFRDFAGQKINWPKSYVDFNSAPNPSTLSVIPFIIYYTESMDKEQKDLEAEFKYRMS